MSPASRGQHPKEMPRTPEDPSPQEVYMAMAEGEPYTAGELHEIFEKKYDVSRWTIKRRLDDLANDGFIERKEHSEGRVSFWVPTE